MNWTKLFKYIQINLINFENKYIESKCKLIQAICMSVRWRHHSKEFENSQRWVLKRSIAEMCRTMTAAMFVSSQAASTSTLTCVFISIWKYASLITIFASIAKEGSLHTFYFGLGRSCASTVLMQCRLIAVEIWIVTLRMYLGINGTTTNCAPWPTVATKIYSKFWKIMTWRRQTWFNPTTLRLSNGTESNS